MAFGASDYALFLLALRSGEVSDVEPPSDPPVMLNHVTKVCDSTAGWHYFASVGKDCQCGANRAYPVPVHLPGTWCSHPACTDPLCTEMNATEAGP